MKWQIAERVPAQMSSSSFERVSKLGGPSPKAFVLLLLLYKHSLIFRVANSGFVGLGMVTVSLFILKLHPVRQRRDSDNVKGCQGDEQRQGENPYLKKIRYGKVGSLTKLSDTGIEAKTRHRVSLVSAHVTTLEEDLKQQPLPR
ncbi:hypothetical protein TNCV_4824751 [Trichonephila clavipes]|nr:hypothetical protein TNCV_4824751 [Trichonephila clavipes]